MKIAIAFILLVLNAILGFPFPWLVLLAIPFAWNIFRIGCAGLVLFVAVFVAFASCDKDAIDGVWVAMKEGFKEGLVK